MYIPDAQADTLHFPHETTVPIAEVFVNERNAMSYYPYVQGGPVEGGYLTMEGIDFVCYVNSRYTQLSEGVHHPACLGFFPDGWRRHVRRCDPKARARVRSRSWGLRAVPAARADLGLPRGGRHGVGATRGSASRWHPERDDL